MKDIRQYLAILLSFIFVIFGAMVSFGEETNPLENFDAAAANESLEALGWIISNDANAPVIVSNEQAKSGPNSAKFIDNSPAKSAIGRKRFDGTTKGTLKCSVFVPNATQGDCYITVISGSSSAGRFIDLIFASSGVLKRRDTDNSTQVEVGQFPKDKWVSLQVDWDIITRKYQVALDGQSLGEFTGIGTQIPDRVEVKAGSNAGVGAVFYVDDFQFEFK